eukprot:CAMPEP_0172685760 /NCGR_PEP_ID=MMETSP1074-20121228/20463_1 /TAXON_ID=2916 /ORGANISM="Ceratium fusus, Strain PA161109" /LENGTH=41 /DNA_ID= /DNA_START= /DNA_END= /DNA_ORIENTATION=
MCWNRSETCFWHVTRMDWRSLVQSVAVVASQDNEDRVGLKV